MNANDWIDALRNALREFYDIEYQRRVWISAEGPEVSSYEEAINRLFDDVDLDGFLRDPRFKDSEAAVTLTELKRLLEACPSQMTVDMLIKSEEWTQIVSLAKRVSDALAMMRTVVTGR